MASNLRYVVVEVDGAGSGGQGSKVTSRVKRRLGQEQVSDQVHAVNHLVENMPYIDRERVAVSGVSYGGYMAGMILASRQENHFKCGVAVSPVVDWRFYGGFEFCR